MAISFIYKADLKVSNHDINNTQYQQHSAPALISRGKNSIILERESTKLKEYRIKKNFLVFDDFDELL